MKNLLLLFLLCSTCFASCIVHQKIAPNSKSMIGASEETLRKEFGAPDEIVDNGSEGVMFVYRDVIAIQNGPLYDEHGNEVVSGYSTNNYYTKFLIKDGYVYNFLTNKIDTKKTLNRFFLGSAISGLGFFLLFLAAVNL